MIERLVLLTLLMIATVGCDAANEATPPYPNELAEHVEWLRSNATPIMHIAPGSADFADLQPVGRAIGDARIVLLGEQSHGDGTVFLMKARLIEYLHRELGFDVLAFESGLYDMDLAWRRIVVGEAAGTAMRRAVFSIWTGSQEFKPTIDYVERAARSGNPLELAGFDLQFTGTASRDSLVTDLEGLLARNASLLPADPGWQEFRAMLSGATSGSWYTTLPSEPERTRFGEMLAKVQADVLVLAQQGSDTKAPFWVEVLASTADQVANFVDYAANGGQLSRPFSVRRDTRMARNLLWLANDPFRNRKIIVWAATYHIVRDIEAIRLENPSSGFSYEGVVTMGEVAAEQLGNDMYMIGFTAFEGIVGPWFETPRPLSRASMPSLEWMFNEADLADAFLDFRDLNSGGEWLRSNNIARPLGYVNMIAVWPRHLDAVIYNREMRPSTPAIP